jgi:hypothetical protein
MVNYFILFFLQEIPQWVMASSFLRFLDHTWRRTTVGRTPLDKWSAHHRDLYLTTRITHNRQTSMPPVKFEPTISAGEQPQTYALDRAVTGTGGKLLLRVINLSVLLSRLANCNSEMQGYFLQYQRQNGHKSWLLVFIRVFMLRWHKLHTH